MGTVARVYCLLLLVISFFFFLHVSLAVHLGKKKLPSAMVVGTVYCDTCFHKEFSRPSHFIAGASVAVECGDGATKLGFRKEVKTNRRGEFGVGLPLEVGKHIKLIESCSVKLIRSNEPFCSIASSATSAGRLRLKSRRNGVPVYSAGFFTFRPLKQPELCNQKPVLGDQKLDQSAFFFPPIPFVPSPPNIGGIPLPPNPLQPPPSLLPPVFPQPPPSLLPPLVPQPPPSLLPPVVPTLPPFPFLNPPPPPPPAFHFPPLPFPPNPLFPGIPPAKPSKKTSP